MKALVKHVQFHTFVGKSESNHWLPIDNTNENGGEAAAANPVQMLLIAAICCVGIDTVDILRKKRIEFSDFQVEGEGIRFNTPPKILRSIEFHMSMISPMPTEAADGLKRAIDLSLTKYCTVSLSLDRSVKFTARYTIVGIEGKILSSEPWEIPRESAIYERPQS